jgi:S-formylglutathione hydrolase
VDLFRRAAATVDRRKFSSEPWASGVHGTFDGGHGPLTIALRNRGRFRSVSAFAPIVAPSQVTWGQKALAGYLGGDRENWRRREAVALIEDGAKLPALLVYQGDSANFLTQLLRPELLEAACAKAGQPVTLRCQPGYE